MTLFFYFSYSVQRYSCAIFCLFIRPTPKQYIKHSLQNKCRTVWLVAFALMFLIAFSRFIVYKCAFVTQIKDYLLTVLLIVEVKH